MTERQYELVVTPPATRAIRDKLPEHIAAAVVEFITGALVDNPQRLGKRLRADLSGIYSARRGTYRVLYRINEADREVIVLRIEHRRDVYGRHCSSARADLTRPADSASRRHRC